MNSFLKSFLIVSIFLADASGTDCPKFSAGRKVGTIEAPSINEASGFVASRKNANIFWIHNDDGLPYLYAITSQGKQLGIYNLDNARMRDWEDIAVGPGPDPNLDYLYVGAIGDNASKHKTIWVYRVPEPVMEANKPDAIVNVENVEKIEMVYPDGPRNAETLIVDPLTKDIYIITKEKTSGIYRAPYPHLTSDKNKLEFVGKLSWGMATGGDISPDGQMIIVRNYVSASIWLRLKKRPMWRAFEEEACKVPLIVEPQGESICFDANGSGYYTTSENKNQPIYYFPLIK